METTDINTEQTKEWDKIQIELANMIVEKDTITNLSEIMYIGGLYLLDDKSDPSACIASIAIIDFDTRKCVYSYAESFKTDVPYISGYIGFREVPIFEELYEKFMIRKPEYSPDLLIINSYGKLHPHKAGSATQLAISLKLPIIGTGQTILNIDGLSEKVAKSDFKQQCQNVGEYAELVGQSGTVYGAAVKTSTTSSNPVYVTVGSNITLTTAIDIVINCSEFRTPDPIRKAEKKAKDFMSMKKSHTKNALEKADNSLKEKNNTDDIINTNKKNNKGNINEINNTHDSDNSDDSNDLNNIMNDIENHAINKMNNDKKATIVLG